MINAKIRYLFVLCLVFFALTQSSCKTQIAAEKKFQGSGGTLKPEQSGVWSGHWIQAGVKGEMSLDIVIAANKISGEGSDQVGPFTLNGSYDENGTVEIRKQYINAHEVIYRGVYTNDVINGRWDIYEPGPPTSGAFQIAWNRI